jgi:hypothetical protein
VYTVISIFLAAFGKNSRPLFPIIAFLAITKIVNQGLYASIKTNSSKWDNIEGFFNFPKEEKADRHSRILSQIRDWIKCCVFTEEEYNALDREDQVRKLGNQLYMNARDQVIPAYCRYMDFATISG